MFLQIISCSAWIITAATVVRLLSSVSVGMGLQITSCCAWEVTATTLERLLSSMVVRMGLQTICSIAWVVTASTLVGLLPDVDQLVFHELACLESGVATQVTTAPNSTGLHPSVQQPPYSGMNCLTLQLVFSRWCTAAVSSLSTKVQESEPNQSLSASTIVFLFFLSFEWVFFFFLI